MRGPRFRAAESGLNVIFPMSFDQTVDGGRNAIPDPTLGGFRKGNYKIFRFPAKLPVIVRSPSTIVGVRLCNPHNEASTRRNVVHFLLSREYEETQFCRSVIPTKVGIQSRVCWKGDVSQSCPLSFDHAKESGQKVRRRRMRHIYVYGGAKRVPC